MKKRRRINYLRYMRSPQWAEKKRRFFASKMWKNNPPGNEGGWKCYCCEADNVPLDAHHRSYRRLGNENIAVDLVAVCRLCHEEIHLVGKRDKIDAWEATKKVRDLVVKRLKSWGYSEKRTMTNQGGKDEEDRLPRPHHRDRRNPARSHCLPPGRAEDSTTG